MTKQATAAQATKRPRGRPPQITRDDIVNAVLKGGAEPSLAAIAKALRVTPQALYHHVESHSEVVELVFKAVVETIQMPPYHGGGWARRSITTGHYLKDIYDSVPGLAEYANNTPWQLPELFERRERAMETAMAGGYSLLPVFWATRAISEFVVGWVAREHRRQLSRDGGAPTERDYFERAAAASTRGMPLTAAAFEEEAKSADDRFDFTLRALIKGLMLEIADVDGPDLKIPVPEGIPARKAPPAKKARAPQ